VVSFDDVTTAAARVASVVHRTPDEQAARGVVASSSGNHAAALSLVARVRGIPARIVMPTVALPAKVA
jgi:threonine dehydratase